MVRNTRTKDHAIAKRINEEGLIPTSAIFFLVSLRDSPKGRRELFAAQLRENNLDAAIISQPKHILYLTGLPTNLHPWFTMMKGHRSISFLVVDSEGRGNLLLGSGELESLNEIEGFDMGRVKGSIDSVSTYSDYTLQNITLESLRNLRVVTYGDDMGRELKKWIRGLGLRRTSRLGIEEWHMAEAYRSAISSLYPHSTLKGISRMLLSMRSVKGKDEVENITKATRLLDEAYSVAKKQTKRGNTELGLFGKMNAETFTKHGPFAFVMGDFLSGKRSLLIGGLPTSKQLGEGDTVILDFQANHNFYWSDLCRTFVVGNHPTPNQEKAYAALTKAEAAAESLLVPGTKAKEVYDAVADTLIRSGYPRLLDFVGHGIGLDDQEPPWFIPGVEAQIREGMVFAVEPGIYARGIGGMRIEDLYLITKKGCQRISKFPHGL